MIARWVLASALTAAIAPSVGVGLLASEKSCALHRAAGKPVGWGCTGQMAGEPSGSIATVAASLIMHRSGLFCLLRVLSKYSFSDPTSVWSRACEGRFGRMLGSFPPQTAIKCSYRSDRVTRD